MVPIFVVVSPFKFSTYFPSHIARILWHEDLAHELQTTYAYIDIELMSIVI